MDIAPRDFTGDGMDAGANAMTDEHDSQPVVCAWCNRQLRDGNTFPPSHGICDDCSAKFDREAARWGGGTSSNNDVGGTDPGCAEDSTEGG